MADEPLDRLREELVRAARRKAQTTPAQRRLRRGTLWGALAVALVGVPAGATAAGVIDLGGGTTPGGVSYEISRSSGTATCESVEFRTSDGDLLLKGADCRPADSVVTSALEVGYDLTPDGHLLLHGSASDAVASVSIEGVGAVELGSPSDDGRRAFAQVVDDRPHELVARSAGGAELARLPVDP